MLVPDRKVRTVSIHTGLVWFPRSHTWYEIPPPPVASLRAGIMSNTVLLRVIADRCVAGAERERRSVAGSTRQSQVNLDHPRRDLWVELPKQHRRRETDPGKIKSRLCSERHEVEEQSSKRRQLILMEKMPG